MLKVLDIASGRKSKQKLPCALTHCPFLCKSLSAEVCGSTLPRVGDPESRDWAGPQGALAQVGGFGQRVLMIWLSRLIIRTPTLQNWKFDFETE